MVSFDNKERKEKKKKKIVSKKILESKKIIEEEKKKIKLEKKNIRSKKYSKLKNSKIYKFFKIDKKIYSFSDLFGVTIISLLIGAFLCFLVLTFFTGGRNYFKISKDLGKFLDVYETLNDNYYDSIDKDKLVEDAIDGMVSSVGDVYTSYVDSDETDEFDELVNGIYEGIGCSISVDMKIVDVFDDSPSEKAGLKKGDLILKVDDIEITEEIDVDKLSKYIKSEADKEITMIISRDGEEKTINLVRGKVETPVVSSLVYEKNDKKIGYISISIFSSVAS